MAPITKYSIGNGSVDGTDYFQFVNGIGEPTQPQPRLTRLERPGVVYARFRNDGFGGRQPFSLQTSRDVTTIGQGRLLLQTYQTFVGNVDQRLVWKSVDYDALGLRVAVLGVEAIDIREVATWCNSFDDANSFARIRATWTLEFRPAV